MTPRPIRLRPTFTKSRRHALEPDPVEGVFYGRTGTHWFVFRDGCVELFPRRDWEEFSASR
jgi:hypothetical protein